MRPVLLGSGVAAACAAALCVSGCTEKTDFSKTTSTEVIRAEESCEAQGLNAPLRQTIVFLDARAVRPSTDAREFAERNRDLRDLLLSIADPTRIQTSGATELRERVSIAVVPPDGSPAQLLFTGCPPGLTAAELATARKGSSKLGEFFTGDVAAKTADQADQFDEKLIGGLNAAGTHAAAGTSSGPIGNAPFLAGLRASKALLEAKDHVVRLILVSDLSSFAPAGGFAEGITAGQAAGGQFGLAEVDLVAPAGRPVAHKPFLTGWFLAQGANLASAGTGRLALATPAPHRLWQFEGEAAYPKRAEPLAIRIGDDGSGKLAGAWLTLRGTPDRATPMTGTITCASAEHCAVQSDEGGFAQIWNPAPASPPKFNSEWPFAGMRSFAFDVSADRLSGQVFDEAVYIGTDVSRNAIAVTATAKR